jgi:hypothetical protein
MTQFTWRTEKTAGGYVGHVVRIVSSAAPDAEGKFASFEVVKSVTLPSRARAKLQAQRWASHFARAA